jgi:methyl-accepting chemotaxis protein
MNVASVPDSGIMVNVSLDSTGSGNILTSSVRLIRDRVTGGKLGAVNVVFYVSTLKNLLVAANPSKQGGFIVVMQDDMTLVADSVPESAIFDVKPCSSNATQVQQLCNLIRGVGGVQNFGNSEQIMNVPGIGQMRAILQTVSRGLMNWNIFVVLPDSEYYGTVVTYSLNTIYVCLALILIAVVVSGIVTFVVLRTLNQISTCFRHVQQLNLDSRLITNTIKTNSIVYEVRSLQDNFKAMLFTLKSFQKFIPRELVRQLVNTNEEATLGLDRKVCTLVCLKVLRH